MPNHPNRGKTDPLAGRDPKADEVRKAREAAGLTQDQAAELIHVSVSAWRNWEQDVRTMPPNAFEYFLLRTGQFQVGDLQIDQSGELASRLIVRTDDGRYLEIPLRDANIATLSRRFAVYADLNDTARANRLVDIQTGGKKA